MHKQTYRNDGGNKRVWHIEVIWEKFNYLTLAVSGETDACRLISTSTVDSLSLSHSLSPDSAVSVFVYVCAASRDVNIKTTSVMSQARWAATAGAQKSQLPHLKNTRALTNITGSFTPLQWFILHGHKACMWTDKKGFLTLMCFEGSKENHWLKIRDETDDRKDI